MNKTVKLIGIVTIIFIAAWYGSNRVSKRSDLSAQFLLINQKGRHTGLIDDSFGVNEDNGSVHINAPGVSINVDDNGVSLNAPGIKLDIRD